MGKKVVVLAEYQGMAVSFTEEGWINATEAAEKYGKRPVDWLSLDSTKEYLSVLCDVLRSEKSSLLTVKRAGRGKADSTWLHSKLVVPFARWLDIRFAVWCDLQIDGLLRGNHPHYDWKRLRHESKASNKAVNGIVKMILEEQGKALRAYHFSNEARLVNWALTGEFKAVDRDSLPYDALDLLAKLEEKNTVLIGRGLDYQKRKDILEQYAIDRHVPIDERKALHA